METSALHMHSVIRMCDLRNLLGRRKVNFGVFSTKNGGLGSQVNKCKTVNFCNKNVISKPDSITKLFPKVKNISL